MVTALGGPAGFMDDPAAHLRPAPVVRDVYPAGEGVVGGVDSRAVGIAVIEMGGGRARPEDKIDHSVGFTRLAAVGARVGPNEAPLGVVHARTEAHAEKAAEALRTAYKVGDAIPEETPEVYERIG
jgi:thymidine phosphorylase